MTSNFSDGFAWSQRLFHYITACVHERHAVAFNFLHDKTFATEDTGTQTPLKVNAYAYTFCSAEKSIFLPYDPATKLVQVECDDLAGIWRGETYFSFSFSCVGERRHEKTFTREYTLSGRKQFTKYTALLLL